MRSQNDPSPPIKIKYQYLKNVNWFYSGNRETIEAAMRILSEAMMNDPMMTQNLSDLFTEENLAELSAMVRGNMNMGTLLWPSR